MTAAWQLRDITKRFHAGGWFRARDPHEALRGVSLSIEPGERVAIIGESGSGKTTLARAGLGLIPRDGGSVHLFGEDTTSWGRARWRDVRRDAQLLFQDPRAMLNPAMTLGHLLRESAALHRPTADPDAEAHGALAAVGLQGRDDALPSELSGGERRRAGVARLLLARPRLVVADEPTAGLDAALKAELIELLFDRVGAECAVVLISHDLPLVLWCCERVVVMQDGRIVDRFRSDALDQGTRHPHTVALLDASGTTATRDVARGAQ